MPGSRVAGPARIARCVPGDNTMVHAAVAHAAPGDVLVLTSGEPAPVALVGELLATQAQVRGVAGMLVDGAIRDLDELAELGLPIWARYVRAQGATKGEVGELDVPVVDRRCRDPARRSGRAGLRRRRRGSAARSSTAVLALASERAERERLLRERYAVGELSYDINGLREVVEG